ncbi:carbonic anhydrase [Micractinium conductrix]|uniref:Carbonic anhydrase n=1 Tax=Micractinium conductrix TaxID=554055 RepID=A0A2P6VMU8_9CHLO|nr:carbonic anhydrase [Micractinium conductrix]|eukprot:PSC75414.1 carbonic anhydrase [Micractinium conductrix]
MGCPCHSGPGACPSADLRSGFAARLAANKEWAARTLQSDSEYFKDLVGIQEIEVLWIGCSDARVPANALIGLKPGEVFVQRNVGNLVTYKDMSAQSCLEYAVNVLKVKHIIVCGHYGCPAVRAALTMPRRTDGLFSLWIQDIRDTRDRNVEALRKLPSGPQQEDRLVELNVLRQVFNVCTSPVVQQAWDAGRLLAVHGLVYQLDNGHLKALYTTDSAPHKPGSFTRSPSSTSLNSIASWRSSGGPEDEIGADTEEQRMSFEQLSLKS